MGMVEFINGLTGTRMAVAPEREAEYLAAGHTRVADKTAEPPGGSIPSEPPAEQTVADPPKAQAPAAKSATKTSRSAAKKKPAAKRSTTAKK